MSFLRPLSNETRRWPTFGFISLASYLPCCIPWFSMEYAYVVCIILSSFSDLLGQDYSDDGGHIFHYCIENAVFIYIYIYIYIYARGIYGIIINVVGNGHRVRFRTWTRLFAFHIVLISLGKTWIRFILPLVIGE